MVKKLVVLLVALQAGALWAACDFPDSERAEAPEWLCGEPQFEGASFLAIGDKSRMPSVSLQNRFAGRMAIQQVLTQLFDAAHQSLQESLQDELTVSVKLEIPDNSDPVVARRFAGVRVFAKAKSPQRHLYVLVGVPDDKRPELLARARQEIVQLNRDRLLAALGPARFKVFVDSVAQSSAEAG